LLAVAPRAAGAFFFARLAVAVLAVVVEAARVFRAAAGGAARLGVADGTLAFERPAALRTIVKRICSPIT
jgi:hypothetical protein